MAGGADGGIEIKKVGKKNFAAVYIAATEEQRKRAAAAGASEEDKKLGVSRVVKLSDQEAVVLRAFLDTRDFELAAREAGFKEDGVTLRLSVESVKRMLRRPNLKAVLEAEILKATAAEGVGITWVFSEARQIYEGDKVKNDNQIKTLKIIADLVKPRPAGHGVTLAVQQNNINSIYAGKAREATEAELERARAAAGEE